MALWRLLETSVDASGITHNREFIIEAANEKAALTAAVTGTGISLATELRILSFSSFDGSVLLA